MRLDSDLPKNQKHIWFTAIALTIFVIILFAIDVRLVHILSPEKKGFTDIQGPILKSALESMMAGLFAAFILAVTYRWVIASIDPGDRVIEVKPEDITERLIKNAKASSRYIFIGNTATFVSACILPIFCARAQKSRTTKDLKFFIIDPRNDDVLNAYIEHKDRVRFARSRVADLDNAMWVPPIDEAPGETILQARAKLYACIYLCAFASRSSGIKIDLYLRRSFTPFRADVSDREAILTQESKSEAAVAFSARGNFYGWYYQESEALLGQCEEIKLSSDSKIKFVNLVPPSSTKEEILTSLKALINAAPVTPNFTLSDDMYNEAVNRIRRPSHSYAI